MRQLIKDGNSVVLVDHDTRILKIADYMIEIGPEAGFKGGKVISQGTIEDIIKNSNSIIGPYLNDKEELKEFYEKVKAKTKEIPPLQGLKHGSAFVNENYNMYDLSFLAIRYLFDTKSEEEIYHIVMDTEESNELGKTIIEHMFKYYDKILYNEK